MNPNMVKDNSSKEEKEPPIRKTPVYTDPRKIKGDVNDLFSLIYVVIFFGIAIFIFVKVLMTDDDKQSSAAMMNKMMMGRLQQRQQANITNGTTAPPPTPKIYQRRTPGCDIYIAPTSIPKMLVGLYSAKHFEQGSTVIDHMLTIPLPVHDDVISIPQHLLLMRYHHSFCNVRLEMMNTSGNVITGRFIATKPILPGHELFFHMDELDKDLATAYQTMFSNHPNQNTYAQVDKIVKDVLAAIPLIRSSMGIKRKRILDPAAILLLMKNTLLLYDETLAHLIPKTQDAAERAFVFGSARSLVHPHRSVEWVYELGACANGVSSLGSGIYASRNITAGNVIITVPLAHVSLDHSVHSSLDCFYAKEKRLCPLSYTGLVSDNASLQVGDSCPAEESTEKCVLQSRSNARYEWSDQSPWRSGPSDHISTYFFDLVATQDITEGDKIIADNSKWPW